MEGASRAQSLVEDAAGPSAAFDARQADLVRRATRLARSELAPRAARIDRDESYPFENVRLLREAGFLGMTIPVALGGVGRSFLEATLVIEEIAKACAVSARIVVETNMGALAAVLAYGSDVQKRRFVAHVLAGDKPAICITEPGAGSAATEMTTTAERRGDRYILNGKKHWITGGGVSKAHLVFARVIENGLPRGIAGFIAVRGEDRGLEIGRREPTMGLRGIPETEIILDNMEIAAEMALFADDPQGRGFAKLMTAYNSQRVGAAAVALGIGAGALDAAVAFVKQRRQFDRPLAEFQGLQWMLADMAIELDAARALLHRAASSERDGFPDMTLAAKAKVKAAETAVRVTNDALQLHGAAGYSRNNPLERMVRDARMFTIGGGTAQVLRNAVASALLGMKLPQTRDGYRLEAEESDEQGRKVA